jgi:hypothetical protein
MKLNALQCAQEHRRCQISVTMLQQGLGASLRRLVGSDRVDQTTGGSLDDAYSYLHDGDGSNVDVYMNSGILLKT